MVLLAVALGILGGYGALLKLGFSGLPLFARLGGGLIGGGLGSYGGSKVSDFMGLDEDSWGRDGLTVGGGIVGGGLGTWAGGKLVPGEILNRSKYTGGSGPVGEGNVIGEYSGRSFNPENAGGTIQNLSWENAEINQEGIQQVKTHLSRFDYDEANYNMVERLNKISNGEMESTDYDKRFYTHEMTEYQRYKNLGIEDRVDPGYDVWNDAHTATLEDYKFSDYDENGLSNIYHPDALK